MQARALVQIALIPIAFIGLASCGGDNGPTAPSPTCTYALAPATVAYGPERGSGAVTITTDSGCTWSASGAPSWIAITGSANGSGTATLAYTVAANDATSTRSATLMVGGQSHSITQQGRPATVCTYDLSPASAEYSKDAASGTFAVNAPADCAWTAVSDAPWLTLTSGQQGTGSGSVSYAISRNLEITDRRGTIAVADHTFAVRQSGDIGGCVYTVAPVELSSCMEPATVTFSITTQDSCPWTASPNASWLSVPASGAGSRTVTIAIGENYDAPRDGIVMVRWPTPTAGQNVRVAQGGCLYAVSRSTFSLTSAATTRTFDVIQQSQPTGCGGATQDRCLWSAVADVPWITITTSMPQRGDNRVGFSVAANDSTAARVGHITVRDQVVEIMQVGR
ncbi:MAG TPA: BACON domain-containing carbohydrate-binding protein [Vicinamibacterales bacterium]|nr:BACON domain-containing carbohydrate-binding protein [Vicinamibacterales bacterium]